VTRIGVIARADGGGLAALTYEVWRNVRPDMTLVVDLGIYSRSIAADVTRYDAPWTRTLVDRPSHPAHLGPNAELFMAECDVVYTAETMYDDRLYAMARSYATRTVVHVMPELFGPKERMANRWWTPTRWEIDRLPAATEVVPVGVACDQYRYRRRTDARVFFHTSGEAMMDRNGWNIVRDSLPFIERPSLLYVRGGTPPNIERWTDGRVTVQWLPPVDDYTRVIPDDVDVMLLPRRYAGLSLPVQEAAAQGIPTVMLRTPPQTDWFTDDFLVPATISHVGYPMKGGPFNIYTADPRVLARMVDRLGSANGLVAAASEHVYDWAQTLDWVTWGPEYRRRLEAIADE
jgi:hypothetical protein